MIAFSRSPCSRSVCIQYSKLDTVKTLSTHRKINAIWWNIKINVQNWHEYEMPTNLQNFTQKDLTEVKILQKVLGGYFFSETPCTISGAGFLAVPCSADFLFLCRQLRWNNLLWCSLVTRLTTTLWHQGITRFLIRATQTFINKRQTHTYFQI